MNDEYGPEDYDGKVVSFDELRRNMAAGKGASDWTPLDMLKHKIEQIERGEIDPDTMLVVEIESFVGGRDGTLQTEYSYTLAGTRTTNEVVGVMERIKNTLLSQ